MKPNAVTSSEDPASGDLSLTFTSDSESSFTVRLTPEIQSLALLALLATPADPQIEQAGQHSAQGTNRHRTLLSTGTRPFHLANGLQGLRFHMGPTGSIDVAFPAQAIPAIQKALEQLSSAHLAEQRPKH